MTVIVVFLWEKALGSSKCSTQEEERQSEESKAKNKLSKAFAQLPQLKGFFGFTTCFSQGSLEQWFSWPHRATYQISRLSDIYTS